MNNQNYVDGVLANDRRMVAKTITLIQSSLASHQEQAKEIIDALFYQRLAARCVSV